jgi:MYXO-CTERM domain-containing protein
MSDSRAAFFQGSILQGALAALVVSLSASPAGALTLAAAAATDLDAMPFATNLGNPVDVAELPDGRVVVIEKGGNVKVFTPGMEDPVVSMITVVTDGQNEQGLLGIVADPNFAKNSFVYFYASSVADVNNRHRVLRYKLGADSKITDMKVVIDMGLRGPANHNGGGITIYGGNLYVGVGDTGFNPTTAVPRNRFGSCLDKANGKILRVSLAEATLGQPVADNPLVALDKVTGCSAVDGAYDNMAAPEKRIFAWGFRNPFRVWADPVTGKIWVGDVGEVTQEEIDIVEKGKHYGYPFVEGTKAWTKSEQAFQPDGACMGITPAVPCVAPVATYSTKNPDGAVMGGRILDGCGWPAAWKSRYIFGDHEQGKIWTVDVNATRDGVVADSQKDFATSNGVTAMRMGTDNALYIVERGAGTVTRITAKAAPAATPGSCLTTNPAPDGGGGAGGAATGGTGGAATAGQSSGGTNAAGGSGNTSGGSGATAAGTSTTSAGTSNGSGGSSSTGTAGSSGEGDSADDGGCGCRVAGQSGSTALGLGALVAALGTVLRRRRARRS